MLQALPPVFAGLEPDAINEASALLQPVTMEAGEVVMEQGEEDLTLAFITQGHVSLIDGGVRIGGAGARDMLGETELFGQVPRMVSAVAASPLQLLVLDHADYLTLCERGNPAVYNIERHAVRKVGERLRWFNDGIAERTRGDAFKLNPAKPGLFARLTASFRGKEELDLDGAAVLAKSPLFSWAGGAILQQIAEHFEATRFEAETVLCRQGEPGERMFVIASGSVDVTLLMGGDRAEKLATLGAGQAFGDASMAQGTPRSASCVCHEEVLALTLERGKFLELYAANDAVGSVFRQGLVRNLVTQLIAAQARFVHLAGSVNAEGEAMIHGTPVSTVWRD